MQTVIKAWRADAGRGSKIARTKMTKKRQRRHFNGSADIFLVFSKIFAKKLYILLTSDTYSDILEAEISSRQLRLLTL